MLKRNYAAGYWRDDTLYALAQRHAQAHPDKCAVRDSYGTLSYGELVRMADRVARELDAAGLKPGDRVAVWLPSRVEITVFVLACSRNRYICCPSLHRNHTVAEILTLCERMAAAAFVGEAGYGADADRHDIFEKLGDRDYVRKVFKCAPRSADGVDPALGLDGKPSTGREISAIEQPDTVVYLAFTSGTTGEPKGVMHSDNTLLSNARELSSDWGLNSGSVIYTLSPLSHNLGFGAFTASIACGSEVVLHDLPRTVSILERLREVGATFIFGVPAHAMDLLEEMRRTGADGLEKIEGFRISGAAVSSTIVEGLQAFGIKPQSGYGMTEACSHHYTRPNDPPELISGSSGRSCDGYEVRIFSVSDPDEPVAPGTVGQIGGRGASLMLGYFDNQLATERSFNRSGWFMTGDLGWEDENGYLRITGRIKDVIIRGGHNIHPAHMEMLTMRHPSVERAAAVPVKDERLGEKVCLAVMPRKGQTINPEQLLSYLDREGLSKYDMPEYFLSLDEIPLSANGKILKRELLDPIQNGTLRPTPIRFQGSARSA
ncbi:acyl--CoA ligase [Amorphus sp. 3PC139-8]